MRVTLTIDGTVYGGDLVRVTGPLSVEPGNVTITVAPVVERAATAEEVKTSGDRPVIEPATPAAPTPTAATPDAPAAQDAPAPATPAAPTP